MSAGPVVSEYPFDLSLAGLVTAAGTLVVPWDSGGLINWRVEQVTVEMANAPIGATCDLRKGDRLITPLVPAGDVAGGDPPVLLRPGETMSVNWAGCTPGATGRVFVIYYKIGWVR